MKQRFTYYLITILIALVWITNGLLCKILNLVPRHQQIVSTILGETHASLITISIGILEVLLGIWILTMWHCKATALFQVTLIITMNVIELIVAPHLLLWGRFNIFFALLFCYLIYYNAFRINTSLNAVIP